MRGEGTACATNRFTAAASACFSCTRLFQHEVISAEPTCHCREPEMGSARQIRCFTKSIPIGTLLAREFFSLGTSPRHYWRMILRQNNMIINDLAELPQILVVSAVRCSRKAGMWHPGSQVTRKTYVSECNRLITATAAPQRSELGHPSACFQLAAPCT